MNIHQPLAARRSSDNIETNTTEGSELSGVIDPMELSAPKAEIGPTGIIFDAALDEALDSVLMRTHPPSMDAYNPPTTTISHEEKQTLYNTQLAMESSKEPCNWVANSTAHPFAISQNPSPIGLSPSFLNTTQSDYLELDELRTENFGPIVALSPTPNDTWLDNNSWFAGLASAEQGMEPMTAVTLMGEPEKTTPRKQRDEFEYVLGGIGGEVPLIQ
ncbi:hypothetical protein N7533_007288 [Penicillium manginii]|jgi:hypothetical protein|uniref:uncharacterized protein n=1 Tax=Penicillium manginii TaxID=203109 RepID=UPI0025489A4B|nr:uncharacterized protein N7533_007288 [Penicillium manginii]KAJ5750260.1 hypothetical protein N7533_007288 [Penicillium manginii]